MGANASTISLDMREMNAMIYFLDRTKEDIKSDSKDAITERNDVITRCGQRHTDLKDALDELPKWIKMAHEDRSTLNHPYRIEKIHRIVFLLAHRCKEKKINIVSLLIEMCKTVEEQQFIRDFVAYF
jgi:hypothetical protein